MAGDGSASFNKVLTSAGINIALNYKAAAMRWWRSEAMEASGSSSSMQETLRQLSDRRGAGL